MVSSIFGVKDGLLLVQPRSVDVFYSGYCVKSK